MKNVLAFTLLSLTLGSTAMAANPQDVLAHMIKDSANKTIFGAVSKTDHGCPDQIRLEEIKGEEGDNEREFTLNGVDHSQYFTHEGNRLIFNLDAKEGKAIKDSDLDFEGGYSYTKSNHLVKNGVLTNEYSAKILSRIMIATSSFVTQYDSNKGTISYEFKGNGVEPVKCIYSKAEIIPEPVDRELREKNKAEILAQHPEYQDESIVTETEK